MLVLVVAALTCFVFWVSEPRPTSERPEAASREVDRMWRALRQEAWLETGAVEWDFGGRQQHLWDRERSLSRVSWGSVTVLQHLSRREGLAFDAGQQVTDPERRQELVEQAWAHFANDSFWLAAPFKARDPGTSLGMGLAGEDEGVLVSYAQGGVTPGDAYLWVVDAEGRPVAWRMWVSILPIGGERTTWEGWLELDTGAWVATRHRFAHVPFELVLSDVRGAATLSELTGGDDPFEPLVGE